MVEVEIGDGKRFEFRGHDIRPANWRQGAQK
jgi:hypothetical protein